MADRRERAGDPVTAMQVAFRGMQADIWTALPAAVVEYSAETRSCSLQPLIKAGLPNKETREVDWIDMPILLDCPVIFPGGGGCLLTFPLLSGDEGLVILASRCIDGWWEFGGSQPQLDLRMHDLSDGFFLPGVESKPALTPAVSATETQLRTKDGLTSISLGPLGVKIISPITISLVAPLVTVNGVPIP